MGPRWWPSLRDGLFSGAVIALAVILIGQARGASLPTIGGWLFLLGIGVTMASFAITVTGRRSPPGLLGLLRDLRPEPEPREGRTFWMDRLISADNTWLLIGTTILLIAFLPPFLGLGLGLGLGSG